MWQLGPVPLRAYALCILVGIIVAIIWSDRRWVARGGTKGTVTDIAVFAVPFGLVGGRLYHVATDWHKYFGPDRNPLDIFKVWEGGLGIWGAVALGAVGAWIGCRVRGVPLPAFADAVAPGLILAQAIGRLGNWFNQELYGGPTELPWGLEIYRRIDPESGLADPINGIALDQTPVEVVHPTFLYELLWNVAVVLLLVWADRKFRMGHGRVFALYVAAYSFGRLFIEMMRTDEATHIFGVRINVYVSLVMVLLGLAYLFLVRGKREEPALLRGKDGGGDSGQPAGESESASAGSTASATAVASTEVSEASSRDDSSSGTGGTEKSAAASDDESGEESATADKASSEDKASDKSADESDDKPGSEDNAGDKDESQAELNGGERK